MIQPCDSFTIQKLKRAWTTHWENHRLDSTANGKWKVRSGRLHNPGKPFFLELAALVVREVNQQLDVDGLMYARKAMIMAEMTLNTNDQWEVKQFTPQLQVIIRKRAAVFNAA